MAVFAQQHVLRLQVTVNDVHRVQMLQSKHNLRTIKPAPSFRESAGLLEVKEELSTAAVLQDEVQLPRVLEGVMESDNKRMVHTVEDLALSLRVHHLVPLHDVVLPQNLHRVRLLLTKLRTNQKHLSVRALSNDVDRDVVFHVTASLRRAAFLDLGNGGFYLHAGHARCRGAHLLDILARGQRGHLRIRRCLPLRSGLLRSGALRKLLLLSHSHLLRCQLLRRPRGSFLLVVSLRSWLLLRRRHVALRLMSRSTVILILLHISMMLLKGTAGLLVHWLLRLAHLLLLHVLVLVRLPRHLLRSMLLVDGALLG
mmetsp:Transcript_17233/g.42736  ORF Transcript_17233/g.42736 Transcript_17233/m.42736 type:complete len:312 (-) Transcript_17233:812-1747(-)